MVAKILLFCICAVVGLIHAEASPVNELFRLLMRRGYLNDNECDREGCGDHGQCISSTEDPFHLNNRTPDNKFIYCSCDTGYGGVHCDADLASVCDNNGPCADADTCIPMRMHRGGHRCFDETEMRALTETIYSRLFVELDAELKADKTPDQGQPGPDTPSKQW